MNPKLKTALKWGLPLVAGTVLILFLSKKKKQKEIANAPRVNPGEEINLPVETAVPTSMFPLQKGSNNAKVKELQSLLGVTADGAFGPITEDALVKFAGTKVVESQERLDQLKKQAAGKTNMIRANDLLNKFKQGGQAIYVATQSKMPQVVEDSYHALFPTGKLVTLLSGKVYNNQDYVLKQPTKMGDLLLEITRGTLKGLYILNPNNISLTPA